MTDIDAHAAPETAAARISAALDAAVAAPGDRAAAWRVAEVLAADWSERPLADGDGYSDADLDAAAAALGLPLPAALREALKLFGRRDDLTRNQDPLTTPENLETHEGALLFRDENQGVCWWGVLVEDLDQDDPPTYYRADLLDKTQEEWMPWTDRLSLALVEALMSETVLTEVDSMEKCWAQLGPEALEDDGLTALPRIQPEWYQTTWYVGDDLLAHAVDGAWISVLARSREALNAYTGEDDDEESDEDTED
ncbi:SMI1/KNR4 family protein [Catenulispora rubra]|uniref:SMI1/KNR4 family protein n=1 Tax=Catenulispora rubra TaxID=280293 RepID=UPI001891FB4A|nr:SMI1/KNR4 family protein [Catenulispora rubra]